MLTYCTGVYGLLDSRDLALHVNRPFSTTNSAVCELPQHEERSRGANNPIVHRTGCRMTLFPKWREIFCMHAGRLQKRLSSASMRRMSFVLGFAEGTMYWKDLILPTSWLDYVGWGLCMLCMRQTWLWSSVQTKDTGIPCVPNMVAGYVGSGLCMLRMNQPSLWSSAQTKDTGMPTAGD